MEKVYRFRADGVVSDLPPHAVPPDKWTGLTNFTFRDGVAKRAVGYDASTVLNGTCDEAQPWFILQHRQLAAASRTPTIQTWYMGRAYGGATQTKVALVDPTNHVDYTPGGGWGAAVPGKITGGVLNTWTPYLNSQTAPPLYYDPAGGGWATLTGPISANTTFNALRDYREFLIGLGELGQDTKYRSDQVYWSDAATFSAPPGTWTASGTNQAGNAVLPGGGEVVDGMTLGQDFLIYKRDGVYRMTYTGGTYVMAFRMLFRGWGPLSQNCIATDGDKHYVYTGDDLIVTDGQRWESLVYGKVRNDLRAGGYSDRLNSHVWYDPVTAEVYVNIVGASLSWPAAAIVINTKTGAAGARSLPTNTNGCAHMAAYKASTEYSYPLFACPGTSTSSSGRIYGIPNIATATGAGSTITGTLVRDGLDFGDPSVVKQVNWVRPRASVTLSGTQTVTVEVCGRMNADDTVSYGTAGTFTLGSSDKVDLFTPISGRYLDFRISQTDAGAPMTIDGFDVGYTVRGAY